MALTHTPSYTYTHPDYFLDEETDVGYTVYQDTYAEDPRGNVPDEHACVYVFRGPNGYRDDVPENIAAQAFNRYFEYFEADKSLALTKRWLAAFHPELKLDVLVTSANGYSQGEWRDVFAAVAEGYGTAESHVEEFRQWANGDVWIVDPDDDDALGGIYADDAEDAVKQYLADRGPRPEDRDAETVEVETHVAGEPEPIRPEPDFVHGGISRWHLEDGAVISDSETAKPGVYFYGRGGNAKAVPPLADPAAVAAAILAAAATHARDTESRNA